MENNKINIAEILKDKPKGTKLYSPIFGVLTFDKVEKDLGEYTIFVTDKGQNHQTFMADGRYDRKGECVLFPSKEMRDWSKFAWKKGDVLVIYEGWNAGLFAGFANEDYTKINLAHYYERRIDGENVYIKKATFNTDDFDIDILDSAEKYISTIEKRLGGKLNMETLEVEKPEFKDGDILFIEGVDYNFVIIFCSKNPNSKYKDEYAAYASLSDTEICYEAIHDVISFDKVNNIRIATEDEKQLLVNALAEDGKHWNAETKQIEDIKPKWTPKPFDKVLVRDRNNDKWRINLFERINSDCIYVCLDTAWKQCIPYNEETAKLIGTTDNWEG